MSDAKELGEALVAGEQAAADIGQLVSDVKKDGFQIADVMALVGNVVAHANIYIGGVKGASEIPAEIKDMKKSDVLRLVAKELNAVADKMDA